MVIRQPLSLRFSRDYLKSTHFSGAIGKSRKKKQDEVDKHAKSVQAARESRDLNARETQELTAEYRKWEQMLRELNERMLRHMGKDPSQWVVQVQDQEVHVRHKSEVPEQESPQ